MNALTNFKMPGGDALMNRFFRRVDDVVWDLMTGKLGIRTKDGIASIEGEGEDAQINLSFFESMALPIPAFAQNTPKEAVNIGDLIYTSGETPGWVVSKTAKAFRIMRPGGTTNTWTPPKVAMFGLDSGVMVVRSLTTMLPGGAGGLGAMQGMLMPMLLSGMMDGEGEEMEKMIPMMLMMQAGAAGADPATAAGAMAPMMQMMQMQMMMKMFTRDSGDDFSTPRRSGKTPFTGR